MRKSRSWSKRQGHLSACTTCIFPFLLSKHKQAWLFESKGFSLCWPSHPGLKNLTPMGLSQLQLPNLSDWKKCPTLSRQTPHLVWLICIRTLQYLHLFVDITILSCGLTRASQSGWPLIAELSKVGDLQWLQCRPIRTWHPSVLGASISISLLSLSDGRLRRQLQWHAKFGKLLCHPRSVGHLPAPGFH